MAAPVTGVEQEQEQEQEQDQDQERLRRWRLVLGGGAADGTGCALSGQDAAMDGALTALYGKEDGPRRGSGPSSLP